MIDTVSGSPTENTVIAHIPILDGVLPTLIAVNQRGSRVYVASLSDTSQTNGVVSVIDTATNTVSANVAVASGAVGLVLNPVSPRLYVGSIDGSVDVIDTSDNTALNSAWSDPTACITIKPDGTRLYVAIEAGSVGGVTVLDSTNDNLATVAAVTHGTFFPAGMVAHPDGSRVYVTNFTAASIFQPGNTVSVLDTATNTFSASSITVAWLLPPWANSLAASIPALIALVNSFHLKPFIEYTLDKVTQIHPSARWRPTGS